MFRVVILPLVGGLVAAGIVGLAQLCSWKPRLPRATSLGLIGLLAAAFCAVFSWFGVLHYQAMNAHQTDLALMDQIVWTTLHGSVMHTTLQGTSTNFLSYHVEPIMALIGPLQLLIPSAGLLVALQTVGLGVAAIPIGLWARKRLGSGVAAVLIALAFLLSPVIANDNDLLFEQIPLSVPFLAFAFYFQLQRRWKPFWVCLVLALAVREEIAFVAMAMGLYALLVQRQRMGWAVIGCAVAWAAVALGAIIPHFSAGQAPYWVLAFGYVGGSTPAEVARNLLTHPLAVFAHLASPPRPFWVLSLLAPLGFLPLAGWRVSWLALPTLGYLLLGSGYYDPNSWYPSPMLPFLFFGAIQAVAWLRRFVPASVSSAYLAGAAAVSFHFAGAGPGSAGYSPAAYIRTPNADQAAAMIATIPRQASVAATPQIIGHLSQRMEVTTFPELLIPEDVFAIDFIGWRGWHGYPATFNEYEQALRRILHDPAYGAFYQGDGLLLLKRGVYPAPPSHPMTELLGQKIRLLGYDAPAVAQPGKPLTVHLRWEAVAPLNQQYTMSLQLGTEANGKLAQRDSWPWDGYFPTVEWPVGQEIDDPQTLTLPASLPPGQYRLFVSVYGLDNGQAKPLATAGGQPGVMLGPFTIQP